MSSGSLENFTAYTKALERFDRVVDDMDKYMRSSRVERLVSQQLSSADFVPSNIITERGRVWPTESSRISPVFDYRSWLFTRNQWPVFALASLDPSRDCKRADGAGR